MVCVCVCRYQHSQSHLVGSAVVNNPFAPSLLLLRTRNGVALPAIRLCLNARPVSVFCRVATGTSPNPLVPMITDTSVSDAATAWANPLLNPLLSIYLDAASTEDRKKISQVFLKSFSQLAYFAVDPRHVSNMPLALTLTQASPPSDAKGTRPSTAVKRFVVLVEITTLLTIISLIILSTLLGCACTWELSNCRGGVCPP